MEGTKKEMCPNDNLVDRSLETLTALLFVAVVARLVDQSVTRSDGLVSSFPDLIFWNFPSP